MSVHYQYQVQLGYLFLPFQLQLLRQLMPQPTAADPKHGSPGLSWGVGAGTGSGTGAACVILTLIAKAMTVALKLKSMIEVFFGTEFERSIELCRIVVYF